MPTGYGFVKLRVLLATFASKKHYPCHLTLVLRLDTPINFVRDAIERHHDHTVQDVHVFQGELHSSDVLQV